MDERMRFEPNNTPSPLSSAIGIDLGDRWSRYCMVNSAGEVVTEDRVRTTPEGMERLFKEMPATRVGARQFLVVQTQRLGTRDQDLRPLFASRWHALPLTADLPEAIQKMPSYGDHAPIQFSASLLSKAFLNDLPSGAEIGEPS